MYQQEEKQIDYEEIDLMDYVKVLLKRKRLILVVFLVAVTGAGVFSFYLPKVYKIDTSLEVGGIGGELIEALPQVVEKIKSDTYGILIREKLGIPETKYPQIKPKNPSGTNLIIITIESEKTQQAKTILEEMDNLVIKDHSEKIKTKKELLENNISIVENNMEILGKDIERIRTKIGSLEEEKKNLEDRERALEQLSPYQQINQQLSGSLFTLFDIREKLANKKQEIDNLYLEINSLENQINSLKNQINSLRAQIDDIRFTKAIKNPTISQEPIKPKPFLNIILAGVLGVFLGIFLAFGKEWWGKGKNKP